MGQSEPINAEPSSARRVAETDLAPGSARPVYDQYRLNQPHDRRAQAVARA